MASHLPSLMTTQQIFSNIQPQQKRHVLSEKATHQKPDCMFVPKSPPPGHLIHGLFFINYSHLSHNWMKYASLILQFYVSNQLRTVLAARCGKKESLCLDSVLVLGRICVARSSNWVFLVFMWLLPWQRTLSTLCVWLSGALGDFLSISQWVQVSDRLGIRSWEVSVVVGLVWCLGRLLSPHQLP